MRLRTLILVATMLCSYGAKSQHIKDSSIFAPIASISYAAQLPAGDLASRFGWNSNIGLNADFKLASNWVVGAGAQFFFGNQLKDTSMLVDIFTSDGNIINQNGALANVVAYERGWMFTANFGRLFPVFGPNPNSGVLFKMGVGYMQHKVRIDAEQDLVPQFVGDYRKLYDRFTSGIALNQFIGYMQMSNNRLANFYGGFDISQGFTKGRRARQAGAVTELNDSRLDIIYGIRFGWIVPIHKRAPREFYFD